MNECWQEEPVFLFFFPSSARLVTCENQWGEMERKKRLEEGRKKSSY